MSRRERKGRIARNPYKNPLLEEEEQDNDSKSDQQKKIDFVLNLLELNYDPIMPGDVSKEYELAIVFLTIRQGETLIPFEIFAEALHQPPKQSGVLMVNWGLPSTPTSDPEKIGEIIGIYNLADIISAGNRISRFTPSKLAINDIKSLLNIVSEMGYRGKAHAYLEKNKLHKLPDRHPRYFQYIRMWENYSFEAAPLQFDESPLDGPDDLPIYYFINLGKNFSYLMKASPFTNYRFSSVINFQYSSIAYLKEEGRTFLFASSHNIEAAALTFNITDFVYQIGSFVVHKRGNFNYLPKWRLTRRKLTALIYYAGYKIEVLEPLLFEEFLKHPGKIEIYKNGKILDEDETEQVIARKFNDLPKYWWVEH